MAIHVKSNEDLGIELLTTWYGSEKFARLVIKEVPPPARGHGPEAEYAWLLKLRAHAEYVTEGWM